MLTFIKGHQIVPNCVDKFCCSSLGNHFVHLPTCVYITVDMHVAICDIYNIHKATM